MIDTQAMQSAGSTPAVSPVAVPAGRKDTYVHFSKRHHGVARMAKTGCRHLWWALLAIGGCGTLGTAGTGGRRPSTADALPPEAFEVDVTRFRIDAGVCETPDGQWASRPVAESDAESQGRDFTEAIVASFDRSDTARHAGAVAPGGGATADVDIFDLGSIVAGDRIIIDTETCDNGLDISLALFDDQGRLVNDNDDEVGLDAFIDHTARHPGHPYFLAVGASFFAANDTRVGRYLLSVTLRRGGEAPARRGQTLLLDFDGGSVNVLFPGCPNVAPPFDAAAIDPAFAGQTELIKSTIIEIVRDDYAPFDVNIVSTDDRDAILPPAFSRVLFGARCPVAFGASESVDHYNTDQGDVAIIYTASFSPAIFTVDPSAEEIAQAIANVASHEVGHLLGLNHVDDPTALMDAVSPPVILLFDQEFKTSDLSPQVANLGVQDAPLLLAETIGLSE